MDKHFIYMQRCFQLARLGDGFVAPNPMVGAVLVYNDTIIGEGYHQCYGEAHAEVNCLNSVKEADRSLISRSTLYVSLEPCAHYGKTPPCADLIIRHQIPKVVISVQDIFSEVNGRGIRKLKDSNVEVIIGIAEEDGKALIRHFLHFHACKRPYVTLKFAQSADGFIGKEQERVLISNALSNRYVHKLRAGHQGIVVGKNTVLTDNPSLNVRHRNGHHPVRIILSDKASIPADYRVNNNEAETIYINDTDLNRVLQHIAGNNIISVLVEGGAQVLNRFIQENLWNEAVIITSAQELKDGVRAPLIQGICLDTFTFEDNTLHLLKNPHAVFNS